MEKARCNTELYSNLREPLNNVKPSNFWGSCQFFLSSVSFSFIETIIGSNLKIATDYCFFFDKSPFCELHAGYWHRYEAILTTYIVA